MSPGWGLHNFELALRRWRNVEFPAASMVDRVEDWRTAVESDGLDAIEPWAVISDDDDFVGRVPGTPTIVSGTLIAHERLVIVHAFEGH